MKILAVLQNQWFKNPQAVRAIFERRPAQRNELIARFLFAGCKTGNVLKNTFGPKLCHRIVWEEASPQIGGESAATFPPDVEHLKTAIRTHAPQIVVAFGTIAVTGCMEALTADEFHGLGIALMIGPHPAARGRVLPQLEQLAGQLNAKLEA